MTLWFANVFLTFLTSNPSWKYIILVIADTKIATVSTI